ncbi:hypothetical protein, conserved [Eimeria brunetti]|uniref:Uncharacterized protein n=1 Tax=Eimeria brunetti TaxID=51314 RepID=U6LBT9_9EIME|nr:hypothetical protein, conserved [Eimeria brunetti]
MLRAIATDVAFRRRALRLCRSDLLQQQTAAVSREDLPVIQADGVAVDAKCLQHVQQILASQIVEACEYYGIPVQQEQQQEQQQGEQQQPPAVGLRVGLLLPPSPLSVAAVAAVAAVGGVAVPLPFYDAAVAAETAAAAAAAAGGVAAASAAAARPLATAVEEAGGEVFVTRTNACSNSIICSSKSLRLLLQQLAEAKTQLLLVHPALAAAAAALCDELGLQVCICGARTPAATDICIGQPQQQQQHQGPEAAAAAAARLFVRKLPLSTRSLSVHTKWVPLRRADGGPLGPPRELKEALADLQRSSSSSSSSSGSTGDNSVTSNNSSSSKSSSSGPLTSDSWGLLLEASRCWGQPRNVLLPAAAVQQQVQRNTEQLLQHVSPGHDAIVAAAAASLAKPKLLLAALLPLLQQQASVLLLTRQQIPHLPLPMQVALQQQPADAAAEAVAMETAHARAAAVWRLLLQQQRQQKQQQQQQQQRQQQYTLVMDVGTAEAMLAHYEHAVAVAAAAAAPSIDLEAAVEPPLAAAADLAAAAQQAICCCVICTDEGDFIAMPGQELRETNGSSSSSSSLDVAAAAPKPAVRVAETVKGWQLLLPAVAVVQHVLTLTEVGAVAVQQQRGIAATGTVPHTQQRAEAAAAAAAAGTEGQAEGVPVGCLLPGVAAVTAADGALLFSSSSGSNMYFERPVATEKAFGAPEALGAPGGPPGRYFRSPLLGCVDACGEVRVLGCTYSSEQQLQRPLQQRLQQWQWTLPRMERLIEGYVHKVPISGKEWGNYHAKKRNWKRIF